MPFIGNQPALSYTSFAKQDFSTSATTSYTLDNPVTNANELALFINFVRQEPTAAYSASGTTLTLTSATASSDDMYCVYLGKALQTVNPPNASVGTSQLVDGSVTSAKLNAGKVLQVVSTTKTDTFTTTSTSFADVTGFSVAITPTATSSKILILCTMNWSGDNANAAAYCKLLRGSTDIFIGDAAGSRTRVSQAHIAADDNVSGTTSLNFLDSPSSTSEQTYKVQMAVSASGTGTFNRGRTDSDSSQHSRGASTITVMEISAW